MAKAVKAKPARKQKQTVRVSNDETKARPASTHLSRDMRIRPGKKGEAQLRRKLSQ